MPQELTPEQRLTQIEQILKSAIKLSHSNTAKIDANAEAIALQDQKIDRLTEQVGRAVELFQDSMGVMRKMQTNIESIQTNIESIQSEIKGLQIENRRMIDRFFNEDSSDENP